jgi:hypothetical protein
MTTFNQEFIQSGDGNIAEPLHVGRPGQQVIFSSVDPANSYAAKYPTIESVPDDFKGEVTIVTPTYTATVKGDGTTKYTTGSGPIADRPSAALFGVGTWQDGISIYLSDGVNYVSTRDSVNVFEFMTPEQIADVKAETALIDVTDAFHAAFLVADTVIAPPGKYLVDNLRYKRLGNKIVGGGYRTTIFKQASTTNPAINCLSDVTTGQLLDIGLINCGVSGATGATVTAVKMDATAPYAIFESNFDYEVTNAFSALEITGVLFSCKFKVMANILTSTAFKTLGSYNSYDLFATNCANGKTLIDTSICSTFIKVISDGSQRYGGTNCTVVSPTIEGIIGTAVTSAFEFAGTYNTIINPSVTDVNPAKAAASFWLLNKNTVISPRTWGTVHPDYSFYIDAPAASSTIVGGSIASTHKLGTHISAVILDAISFVGDTSSYFIGENSIKYNSIKLVNAATYTIDATLSSVGFDDYIKVVYAAGTCTITLPSNIAHKGRKLTISTNQAQLVESASSNINQIVGATGTNILPATAGKWVTLVFNGTTWDVAANN